MIRLSSFLLLMALAIHAGAQGLTTPNGTPKNYRFGYSLGYYGDQISNVGAQIGLERYLSTTKNYQVIGTVLLNGFAVKDAYTAVAITPRVGMRATANFGLTAEMHLGLGYRHTFFQYDDYAINESGQLVSRGKAAQASVMPNLAIGVGYDFRRTTNWPIQYFARMSVNYVYPNRHFLFEARYALETGIIWVP